MANLSFIGICGYSKEDKNREYPCFLGLSKEGDFIFWGYSFWDIVAHSKIVAGEAEKPCYEETETVERITLDNLWVDVEMEFDPKVERAKEFARDLKKRVEKLFPDYDVFITTYPEKTMSKYYHYTDGNLPQNLEDAHADFMDKMRSVVVEDEIFAWPW